VQFITVGIGLTAPGHALDQRSTTFSCRFSVLRMGWYVRSRWSNAKAWFEKFVNMMADSMPNERKKHLLLWMTEKKVYSTYVEETTKTGKGGKPPGYTQFRNMWNTVLRCHHTQVPLKSVKVHVLFWDTVYGVPFL